MLLNLVTLSNNDFPLSKPEFPSFPPTKDLPTGFLSGAGLRLLHRKGYRRAFFFFSPSAGMRKVASGGEEGVRASRALRGTLAPSRTVTGHTGRSNRVSLPAVTQENSRQPPHFVLHRFFCFSEFSQKDLTFPENVL